MTPEEEVARGQAAVRELNGKIYKEARETIRERLIAQLELVDLPADKRQRLNDLLVAMAKVHGYMEQVALGGKMAAQQIERDRTFNERVRDGIRKFG